MTIADAFLAVVVVIAAIAGFRAGATNALVSMSATSAGLVVGARAADNVHWGSGSGRQILAAIVLVGCGAIGLAGGVLLRSAPGLASRSKIPAVARRRLRRSRRRWATFGRTALTLLAGAVVGFVIAKATESSDTQTTSSNTTIPVTVVETTSPRTTVARTTVPVTTASTSTPGTVTIPVTTPSSAPPITTLPLNVTSPSDGTVVTSARLTLTGTAEPGAVVKVGTVAVTAAADTTWRLVVRVTDGVNQIVVTDGASSVTITVVFTAPPTTTTSTSTSTTLPLPTTTTIPIDTEPKP